MFKVGDKVKIRKDLKGGVNCGRYYTAYDMVKYAGKEDTVIEVIDDGLWGVGYKLDNGNGWNWSEEMLEKVEMGGNEMTAKEYLETRARMLKSTKNRECNRDCESCPFQANNSNEELECDEIEYVNPKKAVEIVQKWRNEHPVKTLKDVLLEKFPNVPYGDDGAPQICPEHIGLSKNIKCDGFGCLECWNRPYIDEFEEWLNA